MPQIIENVSLPKGLEEKIVARVVKANRRSLRERLLAFSITALVSLIAIIPASIWLYRDSHDSGFTSFLSLSLSDFDAVQSSFKEFALSLIESLPTYSLAVMIVCLTLLLWSSVSFFFSLHRSRGRKIHLA